MSVYANDIMDTLLEVIASDFTAGESGHDMSVVGRVVEGDMLEPTVGSGTPFVCVGAPTISADSDIWNMAQWGRRLSLQVVVWAPSPDVNSTRRANALALASDIAGKIEDERYVQAVIQPLNKVTHMSVDVAFAGNEAGMSHGYGVAVLSIEIVYQSERGY